MTDPARWRYVKDLFRTVQHDATPFPDEDYAELYDDVAGAYSDLLAGDDQVLASLPRRARRAYLEQLDLKLRGLAAALRREPVPDSTAAQAERFRNQLWTSHDAAAAVGALGADLDAVIAIVQDGLGKDAHDDPTFPLFAKLTSRRWPTSISSISSGSRAST